MSPLTQQDRDMLAAFLDPHRTLLDLAAIGRMSIPDVLAWAQSERIASMLEGLQRLAQLRAALIAGDRAPAALRALDKCLAEAPGPVEARRAATTLLRATSRRLPAGHSPGERTVAPRAAPPPAPAPAPNQAHTEPRRGTEVQPASHERKIPGAHLSLPDLGTPRRPSGSPAARLLQTAGHAKLPRAD